MGGNIAKLKSGVLPLYLWPFKENPTDFLWVLTDATLCWDFQQNSICTLIGYLCSMGRDCKEDSNLSTVQEHPVACQGCQDSDQWIITTLNSRPWKKILVHRSISVTIFPFPLNTITDASDRGRGTNIEFPHPGILGETTWWRCRCIFGVHVPGLVWPLPWTTHTWLWCECGLHI